MWRTWKGRLIVLAVVGVLFVGASVIFDQHRSWTRAGIWTGFYIMFAIFYWTEQHYRVRAEHLRTTPAPLGGLAERTATIRALRKLQTHLRTAGETDMASIVERCATLIEHPATDTPAGQVVINTWSDPPA